MEQPIPYTSTQANSSQQAGFPGDRKDACMLMKQYLVCEILATKQLWIKIEQQET